MCEDTPDRLERPPRRTPLAASRDHQGLPQQPDAAHFGLWLQREAGARWRAGDTALLLWVEPEADLARTHPERGAPVLAEAGRLLRHRLRAVDWVWQVGTQAVVAVLFVPDASVQTCVLTRARQALSAPMVLDGDLLRVRLRAGAASLSGPHAEARDLLDAARRHCQGA
jgi:hypothetical protein